MTRSERDRRVVLIAAIVVTTGVLTFLQSTVRPWASDFEQSVIAGRFFIHGLNPWQVVKMNYQGSTFPFFYPMTAIAVALPLAWLADRWADVVFMSLSSGLLAWVLTRQTIRNPQLMVFASFAFFFAVDTVQWSPLLAAAALVPALGFLLTCKPTIGLVLFAAYPSKAAAIGSVAFVVATLLVAPHWIRDWMAVLPQAAHVVAPVRLPGGVIMLLAALKWRRPEARLLAALACVPHSVGLNEAVLLFLVVHRFWEGAVLVALTPVVWLVTRYDPTVYPSLAELTAARGTWQLWLLYLPCVAMVLMRPNVGVVQPWFVPTRKDRLTLLA